MRGSEFGSAQILRLFGSVILGVPVVDLFVELFISPPWGMKHLTIQIDDGLDLRLRLYAANLNETKAEAACRALSEGIPSWVVASTPDASTAKTPSAARKGGSR
jgi:hypothetical protein